MASGRSSPSYDRMAERRRAVALARHFREREGLSIVQIADRLGRTPATIKAYFYAPTGEKARAVKARYMGVCGGCGAHMQPRNGKGDAYAYCKACQSGAIERRWTRALVISASAMALALRLAVDLLRLAARPRAREGTRGVRATGRRRVAGRERRQPSVRNLGRRAGGGVGQGRGGSAGGQLRGGRADWSYRRFVCPIARNRPQNPQTRGGGSADVSRTVYREFLHTGCGSARYSGR